MMASKLKRCGVKLITGRAVSSIFVKNTKVHGVFIVAPEEELPADVVVLAAGAGATALAAPWACGRDGLRRDSLRCHRALLRDSLLMRD
jgi:phytoene dehydrogenase-like protein